MKRWLAAYVRMHHERKVRDRLRELGIECYLPVQEEMRQWSDRRKKVERVLIPMLIFVRVSPEEQRIPLRLSSVSRYLVLWGQSEPAVIPEAEMERFRFMVDGSPRPVCFECGALCAGQCVRIRRGPLAGLEGTLVCRGETRRMAVSLRDLGYAYIDVCTADLEPVSGSDR